MRFRFELCPARLANLTAPLVLALGVGVAAAQSPAPWVSAPVSSPRSSNTVLTSTWVAAPASPQTPQVPAKETPKEPAREAARPNEEAAATPQPEAEPSQDQSAAVGGEGFAAAAPGGYLDNAIPKTMFRLRYDAAFGINRFDRADFLFGTWKELAFHPHGVQGDGAFIDPKARGPLQLSNHIDTQVASAYMEYAPTNWFSAFVNVPFEYVNFGHLQEDFPEAEQKSMGILPASIRNLTGAARTRAINAALPNAGSPFFPEPAPRGAEGPHTTADGLADVDFGVKAALIADCDQYLTLQLRVFSPSGDSELGIGNGHWTIEPGLLAYKRIGELELQAQLEYWVPLTDDPGAGSIINYGVGVGYEVYKNEHLRIVPITEWMGWTVLAGTESFFGQVNATPPANLILPHTHGVEKAAGDTIINGKIGIRTYFGEHSDLYFGYGQVVTKDRWYNDIWRVEYRYIF